ncbi:hypothetical protein [Aeromicrobium sp. UC242_57]|uniref:hypothetical protein n=1 Tax=Aeromicrobium sp. UC242_57 TaxID=3374624 RepID=UPI00378CB6DB
MGALRAPSLASWSWAAVGGYTIAICGLTTQQNGSIGWVPVLLLALAVALFVGARAHAGPGGLRIAVVLAVLSIVAIGVLFAVARWSI